MDKHSHHKFKKGDFQVSEGVGLMCMQGKEDAKGEMGGGWQQTLSRGVTCMYLYLCVFVLIKVVFRL